MNTRAMQLVFYAISILALVLPASLVTTTQMNTGSGGNGVVALEAVDVRVDSATGIDQAACGTGSNLPCRTISYALSVVATAGDRVVVAPGTYLETITLRPDIAVVSQSGPEITIIDAQGVSGPVVYAYGTNVTASTRLEGFTVTGGTNRGIIIYDASPVISDCVVIENTGTYGGGIAIMQAGADVQIANSRIISNTASGDAGGIWVVNDATLELESSEVVSNTAGLWAGGVLGYPATLVITDTLFQGNSGTFGAGLLAADSDLIVSNSRFYANTASGSGGGIYIYGSPTTFEIRNNTVEYNTAYGGGGIGAEAGSGVIEGNIIRNNTSTGGSNGGIDIGGTSSVDILDNWISGNTTPGLRAWSAARIQNNLILGDATQTSQLLIGGSGTIEAVNNTIIGSGTGSGIQINADAFYTVTNNIVMHNSVGIVAWGPITPTISNNLLWNNSDDDYQGVAIGSSGILADPDFVDPSALDYHLDICSWAVDTGTNISAALVDFDGEGRPFDGDGIDGAVVDIGADERTSVAAPMPAASFTYTGEGLDVSFTNTSLHAVAYQWDFGDGNTSTATHPSHTYSLAGTYQVSLTATNGNGCSQTIVNEVATGVGDVTPPAAVTDLVAIPGMAPGSVTLHWHAPGDDGTGGGAAASYDMRYSSSPISEATWNSATSLIGEPIPGLPGTLQEMNIGGLALGVRWYFALKTVDSTALWSGLSNVPSVQENGFRPFFDGYGIPNFGDVNYNDYTIDDMRRMFGDQAVCWLAGSFCVPKPAAIWWNFMVNWYMSGGHGDGFASTSLRFFKELDDPSDFHSGATTIQELALGDVRRHVAYYHVEQYTDPVAETRSRSALDTPAGVLSQMREAMSGSLSDPMLLFLQQGGAGHALVPYALQELSAGIWQVWVYDSNYPGIFPNDTSRQLSIDTSNNLWSYDTGWATWSGNSTSHNLGVVQLSRYALQPSAPWVAVSPVIESDGAQTAQLWLAGKGHLLVSDMQAQRLGYVDGQYVNEIPGASFNVSAGGMEGSMEPFYTLPLTDTYTISVETGAITQTEVISITQFGPGYAVGVQGIALTAGEQHEAKDAVGSLFIPTDGSEVAYTAFDQQEVDLFVAFDEATESYQFKVTGSDTLPGGKVVLFINKAETKIGIQGSEAGAGAYDLELQLISPSGVERFTHADIDIGANDTHYIEYDNLEGAALIIIGIDHNSDGTIDETVEVVNQAWQVFLPRLALD